MGHTVLDTPRRLVLIDVCRNHLIHHRGQLSVYVRMLGARFRGSANQVLTIKGSNVYTLIKSVYTSGIARQGPMAIAKVFKSGNSQAIRIPKAFQFTAKEVRIERNGDQVILTEARKPTAYGRRLVKLIQQLPDDMMDAVEAADDLPPQTRSWD